jgi:post-segregation antitoxin (ccd killing protein)
MPNTMPQATCAGKGQRPKGCFKAQPTTNHNKTAGWAMALTRDISINQSDQCEVLNIITTATTACTNNTALSMTPTWQASNTKAAATGLGAGASPAGQSRVDKIRLSFLPSVL